MVKPPFKLLWNVATFAASLSPHELNVCLVGGPKFHHHDNHSPLSRRTSSSSFYPLSIRAPQAVTRAQYGNTLRNPRMNAVTMENTIMLTITAAKITRCSKFRPHRRNRNIEESGAISIPPPRRASKRWGQLTIGNLRNVEEQNSPS